MRAEVTLGSRKVGDRCPTFIVAEIGINHNGDVKQALALIEAAADAGVDAVKFQKRTPELCVPVDQRERQRETPWGYISYLEYRNRIELSAPDYRVIAEFCREKQVTWFTSVWDEPSVDFMEAFDPPCYKIPSAALTDRGLLERTRSTGRPLILSTGMSTPSQIDDAVSALGLKDLIITHSTSSYPCDPSELNLRVIPALRERYPVPIGYSGHEVGLIPSVVAVGLGACFVERHITLSRAMWGSDQAASVEPDGFRRLVRYIRTTGKALGDGVKAVYRSEQPSIDRLRRFPQ